jgi:hypothetical protein
MHDLADPYLKTSRAKEHLESLRKELQTFYDSKPYELTTQEDTHNQMYLTYVKVSTAPDRLSLILGDLLYCLRSSLDQLVWCLVKTIGNYPERTAFPIIYSNNSKNRRRFKEQTAGVSAAALAIIESLQPYHAGNPVAMRSHHLWVLNELCNIDKHMRILAYGAEVKWYFRKGSPIASSANFDDADDQGRGILSIPLSLKAELAAEPPPTFKVVFGDAAKQIEADIDQFERIYKFIAEDVVPRFARLS